VKQRIWGFILLVLGILVLLQITEVYKFSLAFWPLVLVAIGLSILIGERPWIKGRFFCGKADKDRVLHAKMRHIGDLYHGRTPWVLDHDYDFYHGIGEVTIRIPEGVNIDVETSVGIGEQLFISERTVKSHVTHLLEKLCGTALSLLSMPSAITWLQTNELIIDSKRNKRSDHLVVEHIEWIYLCCKKCICL